MKIKRFYIESKEKRTTKFGEYIEYIFVAKIRMGLRTKYYKFITMDNKYVCAFVEDIHFSELPKDKETRHKILIQVYGELMKTLAQWKIKETLLRIDREIKEEQKRKEREEKAKHIALGEQISIEKYMKNL